MSCFRRTWSSLNFNKEYLFGFETLVFATSGILSMNNQLVTFQRLEITSYDPFNRFTVGNLQNIFMEHDLYILMIFGIK